MIRIAVLVSGGGTNLQALIDAQAAGAFPCGEIVRVIASCPTAFALERAERAGISTAVIARRKYPSAQTFDTALCAELQADAIDLVVLAGYLSILGPQVLQAFSNRIVNVHPSLIPSFCGAGFYGLRVHQAALAYGVKVTGATVHLVSDVVDGGKILLQQAVTVAEGDTPETLQRRVMEEAEWILLPRAVAMMCGHLSMKRRRDNGEKKSAD